jgi:DNA repair photolyase
MGLNKFKGNMYPWVTHTHAHLRGVCPHRCRYCYVQAMEARFQSGAYAGRLRLAFEELNVRYGTGKKIFVEHCNDLFAEPVASAWIGAILAHCRGWPGNEYVFQTKNPDRALRYLDDMPKERLIGVTIETTRSFNGAEMISCAPSPMMRVAGAKALRAAGERVFLSVEPMLKGDVLRLAQWIGEIRPEFVSVGADSKRSGLSEPSARDARLFLQVLKDIGVDVRIKENFGRLVI